MAGALAGAALAAVACAASSARADGTPADSGAPPPPAEVAQAQNPPAPAGPGRPATPPVPGQASAPAGPNAAPKPKKPPEPIDVYVVPAYGLLAISGSRADYYHYHRPPSHFFLGLVEAVHRDAAGYPLQEFWWRNLGESDQQGYLDAHLKHGPSFLRVWHQNADFYGDPRLPGGPFSNREDTVALVRLQQLRRGPSLDLRFWNQEVSVPTMARTAPFRGVDYRAPDFSFRATVPVGQGQARVEGRFIDFTNQTGRTPNSSTNRITGEVTHPIGRRADVDLGFDHQETGVSGLPSAVWNTFRFHGYAQPTNRLFVEGFWRQQGIDLPYTLTPYANERSLQGVNLSAYPMNHASIRAGVYREEIRQENGFVGQSDRATWYGGDFRFRLSNPGKWNLSLRARERDLQNAPRTAIPGLPDTDTLFYDHDRSVDARFDWFPVNRLDAYFLYGWRQRENGQRNTRLTLNSVTGGATTQLTSRLSGTLEFTNQDWSGNTAPFRNGPGFFPGGLPPNLFFSSGIIGTASLEYLLGPRSTLSLSFNTFHSTGGQRAHDYLATLEYRRDVNRWFFYSIGYQYEAFKDTNLGRSYTAFPLLLQVGFHKQFR